jgi:glycosyltransferase involved in cell wall biosynthesis
MSSAALHLRSSTGLYGAETMLLGLCAEQLRRGAGTTLATFVAAGESSALLAQAARQPQLATNALACRGRLDLRCLRQLRALLRQSVRRGTRVLHCHDYKSVFYAALAAAGLPVARVATVHGWVGSDLRSDFYRRLELRLLSRFDRVCAVSAPLAAELGAAGVSPGRLRCVPNGVDTSRFRPLEGERLPEDGWLRLGTAARLSPEKNLHLLLQAMLEATARGARLRLCIYGEGPERARLEALGAPLLERGLLRMPGATDGLERWYPGLDAFLLPSASEGMPMTVLEALACGCPVVASDVGELPAMLSALPGCRVLPAGDVAALVEALCALAPRRGPLPALRQRVQQRWSLSAMTDGYDAAYREALAA